MPSSCMVLALTPPLAMMFIHSVAQADFTCRFYDPRTGHLGGSFGRARGSKVSFDKPDSNDWLLHVAPESEGSVLRPDKP